MTSESAYAQASLGCSVPVAKQRVPQHSWQQRDVLIRKCTQIRVLVALCIQVSDDVTVS